MKNISLHAWIIILLMILVIYTFVWSSTKEGFYQKEQFVSKRDSDIYDDFYSNIYDDLFSKKFSTQYEIGNIVKETSPTKNSNILDIGCKTGNVVGLLTSKGYNAIGMDTSVDVINVAKRKFPTSEFIVGNPLKSMFFEKESFSHILMLNFSLYHYKD